MISIYWSNTISNEDLYNKTKSEPWSTKIKRSRFLHVLRKNPDTPARKALTEHLTDHKQKVVRQPLTWLKKIKEDLKSVINVKLRNKKVIRELEKMAVGRDSWKILIKNITIQQH